MINVKLKELLPYADVVLRYAHETDEPQVLKQTVNATELDTDIALVYVENAPLIEQPDRLFLSTIQTLRINTRRSGMTLGIHVYENLSVLEEM